MEHLTHLNAYKPNIALALLKNTDMFFFKYEFYETSIIMGSFCILKHCEVCIYKNIWDASWVVWKTEQQAWSTSTLLRTGKIEAKDDGKAAIVAGCAVGFSVPKENR